MRPPREGVGSDAHPRQEETMPTLDPEELAQLLPAETAAFASPIPTQFVSSDEFMPLPQTAKQRQVEARMRELGGQLAKHQGLSRRRFFQTAAGMAVAFVAMNDVYGAVFGVSPAEAATPEMADERAKALAGQFIMDMHTHFLRDDTRLNFIIYHSAFRFTGGAQADGWTQFERTGRVDWVTDLAEIPAKYGVRNVYGDLGQIFAQSTVAEPRLCAAMLGQLIQGLGADHVVWGTDAIWTGAPQWQIEALRRLEIPEDMQQKYGFSPLGPADGPVKRAIFGENSAALYRYDRRAELSTDRIALARAAYEREGPGRTNRRYGYVMPQSA
jgi:hypothetical protein